MSRRRINSPKDVQTAQQRVNGMVSVDETLDLGNGVSVATLGAAIKKVTDGINEYNGMLAELDAKSNLIEADLRAMKELSKQALNGAEFKYGPDSNEYEMIGGTRASDRRRPGRKAGGSGEMK